MKTGFYPGCSLNGTAREYNESVKALATYFGITLEEVEDWNCCGATAAHSLNHTLSIALPARILALAMRQGLEEIVVPCASCYNRLVSAQYELNRDKELKAQVEEQLQMEVPTQIRILNVLQFIDTYIKDKVKEQVTRPFRHKVACYYGCLLVRPHKVVRFDRVEDPQTMDELVRLIGGTPLDWGFKTECCGAGLSIPRTDIVCKLSARIIEDAECRDAECIAVACPMCHANLDMRRGGIERYLKRKSAVPVLYITQLVGLALGMEATQLGLQRHFVPVSL